MAINFWLQKQAEILTKKHKKDFKTDNTTNSLVSHNILTNHTFDFQYSAIFATRSWKLLQKCFHFYSHTFLRTIE